MSTYIPLELTADEVNQCLVETRREYPVIKKMVIFDLAYEVHVRSDGTGWVDLPSDYKKRNSR
jgi:hypothetical protein